jgi:hypothetical protein
MFTVFEFVLELVLPTGVIEDTIVVTSDNTSVSDAQQAARQMLPAVYPQASIATFKSVVCR